MQNDDLLLSLNGGSVMQLGSLEKLVLQYFWENDSADVKTVHADLSSSGARSLNTVQSTLDRLFKKKLLRREKMGHAFVYRAGMSRDIFLGKLLRTVTSDFVESEDDLMVAFTSLSSDLTEAQLQSLEQMIEAQRANSLSGDVK